MDRTCSLLHTSTRALDPIGQGSELLITGFLRIQDLFTVEGERNTVEIKECAILA